MALKPAGTWTESLLDEAVRDEEKRYERMCRAWKAYYGEYKDQLKIEGNFNDNVKGNPARFLVNTGANFLFSPAPAFQATETPETTAEDEELEDPAWLKVLEKIWCYNHKATLLTKMAINGGVTGHVFIKLLPNGRGPDKTWPRMVLLNPENIKVRWNPMDVEDVWEYIIEYQTLDTFSPRVEAVAVRQRITKGVGVWTIVDEESRGQFGEWKQVGPAQEWPYEWAPIVDGQNLPVPNDFWGMADLETDVLDIIERIQYVDSNTNKIIRIHAHPKTVASGMTPDAVADIDVSPDGIITLPDPEAKLTLLEIQSELASSMNFAMRLRLIFNEMTQTPQIVTGEYDVTAGQLSGVNLSIMFSPVVQKTEMKQDTYGDLLLECNRRLLQLYLDTHADAGYDNPWEIEDMDIGWPDVLPGSKFLQRQTLLVDKQLGASEETILELLGYNPDVERANNEAKMEKDMQRQVDQAEAIAATQPKPVGPNVNPIGSMGGVNSAGKPKTPKSTTSVRPTNAN